MLINTEAIEAHALAAKLYRQRHPDRIHEYNIKYNNANKEGRKTPGLETKSNPSEEQIVKFWEWCGFEFDGNGWCLPIKFGMLPPDYNPPPIDLNNLFRYAIPKLEHIQLHTDRKTGVSTCHIDYKAKTYYSGQWEDPALALFWAIWSMINE